MVATGADRVGNSGVDDVFVKVLADTVAALEPTPISYGLIGGVASAVYGRPRCTTDIDIFCRIDEADAVLESLATAGFEVERTNPSWIFKARRDGVVVDVIFKAKAEVYFDEAMSERVRTGVFEGVEVPLVAPEDIIVTKAIAADESSPAHWWDALCIVGLNELDWDYLLDRARKGPNRTASLLHFALSIDLPVPTRVVRQLDQMIARRLET